MMCAGKCGISFFVCFWSEWFDWVNAYSNDWENEQSSRLDTDDMKMDDDDLRLEIE